MPHPHNKPLYNAKDLVAEQSGMFWSLVGLVLALLLGFFVKAIFSSERITRHIQLAANRVHQDVQVQFKYARLSLADGVWPEIAVVIHDVQMTTDKLCWGKPELVINEIKLPLSFKSLFTGRVLVNTVKIDDAQLKLAELNLQCASDLQTAQSIGAGGYSSRALAQTTEPTRITDSTNKEKLTLLYDGPRNPIENVQIGTLRLSYGPSSNSTFRVDKLRFQRKAEARDFKLTGRLYLGAETLAADFSSFAQFNVNYEAGESPMLKAQLKGNWREGLYDFNIDYSLPRQNLIVLGEMKHVPVSQILSTLKKYDIVKTDLQVRSLWLSQKLSFHGSLRDPSSQTFRIDHIGIEGDLGQVKGDRIEFVSLNPLVPRPFELNMRGIEVERLLQIFNRTHPGPSIGALGTFNGVYQYRSNEDMGLLGEHSGLEFIFSSLGKREIQVISLISGELKLLKNKWNISLNQIRPLEGLFDGELKMTSDRELKNMNIDVQLNELQLSPTVVSLVTQGGYMSHMSGQLRLNIQEAKLKNVDGKLEIDNWLYDQLAVERFSVLLQTKANGLVQATARAKHMKAPSSWGVLSNFQPLKSWLLAGDEQIEANDLYTNMTVDGQKFNWTDFRFSSGSWKFQSEGSWNELGAVQGKFTMSAPKLKELWRLSGNRDQYIWEKQ